LRINGKKNAKHEVVVVDADGRILKDHLPWKTENIMDYEWLYERLKPYYNLKVL